jgi:hypothetical protein
MASSRYTVDNWCYNCTKQSLNGIIRNSKFFCSEDCHQRAFKKPHHKDPHKDHHHHKDPHHYHHKAPYHNPPVHAPMPKIEKQCNYCFEKFEHHSTRGIDYGPMWFCCQYHLNLANPRPKAVMEPFPGHFPMPIHVAPQVLPHFMGRQMIMPFGHPFSNVFLGP